MGMVQCSVCGKGFSDDEVVKIGDYRVCPECKPVFLQRLREGVSLTGEVRYGGFWIRAGALTVDGIVLYIANFVLTFVIGLALGAAGFGAIALAVVVWLFSWVFAAAYVTYLLGAHGATLGKMVFGLKVVRPNGDKIGYGTAFGRYWASVLSWVILSVGYIIAAFDDEKRALHDRLCETRVVRT